MPPFNMKNTDRVRLLHMLDAASEALSFVEGRTSDDLTRDRMLLLAVVKDIEIIGEAASRISPECRAATPGIPWGMVVGIRKRLTRAYFDLDLPIIWSTLTMDLPELIGELERVLASEG
ncbi:MAG: DUF86 domain-containing protein [Acidobacteriota bacterium]|nr:DUF86 domain-containing protein [Acidobacteriota bacterium]